MYLKILFPHRHSRWIITLKRNKKSPNKFGLLNPQAPTAYLERFGAKYGFSGIHPHASRHTMTSLSITNGADIVSVSKKLGHAEVSITLDIYSHENEEAKQKASSILNDVIYQKKT